MNSLGTVPREIWSRSVLRDTCRLVRLPWYSHISQNTSVAAPAVSFRKMRPRRPRRGASQGLSVRHRSTRAIQNETTTAKNRKPVVIDADIVLFLGWAIREHGTTHNDDGGTV